MRRTRKRGGYVSDEHGRYVNRETEVARLREAMGKVERAVGEAEKAAASVDFLQVVLSSNVAVKRRGFRDVLQSKLEDMWDRPSMLEHRRLISQVSAYLDSIPVSEIVGGGNRKTQKRGGYIADEEGRYADSRTELDRLNEYFRRISQARGDAARKTEIESLLNIILRLKHYVRQQRFRNTIGPMLATWRTKPYLSELRPLIQQVDDYLASIPAGEITAGGKRKIRTRKVHSK